MLTPASPLSTEFYNRSPAVVALDLLGKALVRRLNGVLVGGLIVETEAYCATDDPASHSHRGLTRRNKSMFAPPGTLYVYSIHAKYCLNATTEPEGIGSAVLIRAVEPVWGLEQMQNQRPTSNVRDLCRGPARLCQALGVTRDLDGTSLCVSSHIWISCVDLADLPTHKTSGRIGINRAIELPLRFFIDRNAFVSGRARDHSGKQDQELHRI